MESNGYPASTIKKIIEEYIIKNHHCAGSSSGTHNELRKRSLSCSGVSKLSNLLIGHSHSHWDHIAGDSSLSNLTSPFVSKTTLVPPHNISALKQHYGIDLWPENLGKVDLGRRILDVIPLPGHQRESIAIYDRETGLLLTGDSVYPGRIFMSENHIQEFKDSHQRLQKFVKGKEVSWVLGCHIEQKKTPFEEYPMNTVRQPDEHVLQFDVGILDIMGDALEGLDGRAGQTMCEEFSLFVKEGDGEYNG
jgi:hydroxyacylglutathione hydrolase